MAKRKFKLHVSAFLFEIAIFYDAILGNLVRNFHRNRSKVDAEDDYHINNLLQFYITHN